MWATMEVSIKSGKKRTLEFRISDTTEIRGAHNQEWIIGEFKTLRAYWLQKHQTEWWSNPTYGTSLFKWLADQGLEVAMGKNICKSYKWYKVMESHGFPTDTARKRRRFNEVITRQLQIYAGKTEITWIFAKHIFRFVILPSSLAWLYSVHLWSHRLLAAVTV